MTPENLAGLGAERLAEILVEVADTRTDLKRRLRMELAAGLGATHLAPEIDKRLGALETSRGQVTWRQKPAFLRDLDALRGLIAERLARQEPDAARERMWRFLATAGQTSPRLRDPDDAFEAIYARAAGDLGRLLAPHDPQLAANAVVEAAQAAPQAWARWMPKVMAALPVQTAKAALALALARARTAPGWTVVIRHLADAAGDVEAYRDTYSAPAMQTPAVAVELAQRWLEVGEVEEAGAALRLAAPKPQGQAARLAAPDFDWETAWLDYLEATGEAAAAQAVRWASFQRTLDIGRAKAFVGRLDGFEDVEAEGQALAHAATHQDFQKGLELLMAWPALPEASRMILARAQDAKIDPEQAEIWAAKLRKRFPAAAHRLLRRGAATAFKQRALKLSQRLSEEADTIGL
ncbi:hypothetical protein CSW62_13710 [Caulobacter sp. FWC2]|nr:hypothetical protein CSW62_13710 [Caulobacter sp. FWC2]